MSKYKLGIITSHGFQRYVPDAEYAIEATYATYADEDLSKGTIEKRLSDLETAGDYETGEV